MEIWNKIPVVVLATLCCGASFASIESANTNSDYPITMTAQPNMPTDTSSAQKSRKKLANNGDNNGQAQKANKTKAGREAAHANRKKDKAVRKANKQAEHQDKKAEKQDKRDAKKSDKQEIKDAHNEGKQKKSGARGDLKKGQGDQSSAVDKAASQADKNASDHSIFSTQGNESEFD